ncbi:cellulose binding domain-containing protein [Spirillospora sp. CA-294931]|uniref:cellulose binding domain-containing protein n=1 Tax=Spirillospora sp. CA-294931 TaxID=3240042 RepID=UPI003D8EC635
MGRHTRDDLLDETEPDPSSKSGFAALIAVTPVPLMPIFALVLAVGVVSYAFSTEQISLNFAGGAPKEPINGAGESQVSQRGPGNRPSRQARRPDGLLVAFRSTGRTANGFTFTATIANKGRRPVPRWALAFKIPGASIVSVRGATVVRTGQLGWVRSRTGAPALAPGRSVKIAFVAQGFLRGPSTCVLNRLPCAKV